MIYTTKRFSVGVEKEFSAAGREWAGFKGGMKGALKGAKWGAILAPGNLIAAGLGHPKTALGITAAGSLVGGGIGFKLGRDSGISEYKYKNDPEYKKKVDKEKEKYYLEDLKSSQKSDEFEAWDFNIKDWKDFSDSLGLPPEILKYIKFYEFWRKNIKFWYSKALPGKDCDYWVAEFRSFFPIPIPAKIVKEWYETDKKYHSITFLTDNDAGDDGYVCYDLDTKLYGIDLPNETNSLKDLLVKNIDRIMKYESNSLSQENIKMIQDFKRHL